MRLSKGFSNRLSRMMTLAFTTDSLLPSWVARCKISLAIVTPTLRRACGIDSSLGNTVEPACDQGANACDCTQLRRGERTVSRNCRCCTREPVLYSREDYAYADAIRISVRDIGHRGAELTSPNRTSTLTPRRRDFSISRLCPGYSSVW